MQLEDLLSEAMKSGHVGNYIVSAERQADKMTMTIHPFGGARFSETYIVRGNQLVEMSTALIGEDDPPLCEKE